jgi:1-acyl-sn-glycerol-3-phosphate acyltransferase
MMAHHMWFRTPLVARIFRSVGAVDGSRENAAALLEGGELVLTYPGGVREIMGSTFRREHIDWEGRRGFAHVAVGAGVPVVPIVGVGVNSGHIFVTRGRLLGKLVFQGLLRLGPKYADYRDPLTIGIIPIPLPFGWAVNFPLPCRLTYYVGEPLIPPRSAKGGAPASETEIEDFARRVIESMQDLIRLHGRPRQAPNQGVNLTTSSEVDSGRGRT